METGDVEANLVKLNDHFKLSYVADLISRKVGAAEQSTLSGEDFSFHRAEYDRLRGELQSAFDKSKLSEVPDAKEALNDLLLRVRGSFDLATNRRDVEHGPLGRR